MSDLKTRFTYHAPHGDLPQLYSRMRHNGRVLAEFIESNVPPSREQALALTKVEEAIMWANAGIARNIKPAEGEQE